jgi:hypothetical protein
MRHERKDIPAELDGVVDRLLAHRAELSPVELDRIKLDSRRRAAAGPRGNLKRETPKNMKTRTSILALLASGVLLSTGGAALGVSGLASSDSAGNAQYQVAPVGNSGTGGENAVVLGASETNPGAVEGAGGTLGQSATAPAVAQPSAQQSLDSGDSLPFTGYAAIPVLLLGLGLLGAGVMMRRRSLRETA